MLRGRAVLGWWRRRRRTEVLTGAADVASSRNLAEQAQSDLLALGAAIDAHPMRGDDDLQAWHRVLDAYDTATRLRSEEHTSELQSLMRISYAVFCLKKKKRTK